jgi:type I restriction enzyme, S subunit
MSFELRALWESAGGTLPESWSIVPLESLFRDNKSIAVGVMYPGDHIPGGTPLIRVGDIRDGAIPSRPSYCISASTNYEHRRTQLVGDELLITLVGSPGECVVVRPDMAGWNPARAIASIKLRDAGLRTYIKTVIESSAGRHLIDAVLNTTVQKTLNLKDIRRLPIPMPERQVVTEISLISEALSERIQLLRETNATLEAIAQAVFKSWFVDFDPVRAKMEGQAPPGMDEATALLFPSVLDVSSEGLVPAGWEVSRMGAIVEFHYGKALKASERAAGTVPVYGSGGPIGYHDVALVQGPGIIVGRKGTIGSLNWEDRSFYPIDTVFYVRSLLPLTYCFELLKTLPLRDMNTDGAVPGLNRNNVYRLQVVVPPAALLAVFDNLCQSLRTAIFQNVQRVACLEALRDTLLPRLISGKLRLANDILDEVSP